MKLSDEVPVLPVVEQPPFAPFIPSAMMASVPSSQVSVYEPSPLSVVVHAAPSAPSVPSARPVRQGGLQAGQTSGEPPAEAATESEWVAWLLESLGHEVIVADPNFAPMCATRSSRHGFADR